MHPRIAELFAYLDRGRAGLDDAIAAVPADVRETKPAPDRWSIAEVIEHLAEIERRITNLITKQIAEAKTNGLARETRTDSVVTSFHAAPVLDRTKKITSPVVPSGTVDAAEGIRQLDAARTQLKVAVMEGDGFDLSTISAPHRIFGPMSMYEWIAFVGSHMARHAAQICETAESLAMKS